MLFLLKFGFFKCPTTVGGMNRWGVRSAILSAGRILWSEVVSLRKLHNPNGLLPHVGRS